MANPSKPFPKHKFERNANYVVLNEKGDIIDFAYFKLKNSASVNKMLQLLRKIDPNALGYEPNQIVSIYNLTKKQVEFVLVKTNGKFTNTYHGFDKAHAPSNIHDMFTIEPNLKESTINYIHNNMKHIQEAASQEAYAIHRMTLAGQDATQNFIDANPGLNIKKLINDLSRNLVNKFEVRDVITNKAHNVIKKKFMKAYVSKLKEASKSQETEFHKNLDSLVHDTFGKRKDEAELTEAFIPSNIKEFSKRKGIMPIVTQVANWAEKLNKKILDGSAIGKGYNTLVLDMSYEGGEIYINVDTGKITMFDEDIKSFSDFKRVYDSMNESKLNEASIDLYQELEPTLNELYSKLNTIINSTTDPKYKQAIQGLLNSYEAIENKMSQVTSKMGVVPVMESAVNTNYKLLTKLIQGAVRQIVNESQANNFVAFNPTIHKSVVQGAIDYELDPSGTIVYAYVPFKEEPNVSVQLPLKKEYVESYADAIISNQSNLDQMDSASLDSFIKNMFKRPDSKYIISKVLKLK